MKARLAALLLWASAGVVSAQELAAGKLLVAARGLPDPNFAETVILLTSYSEKGAMGLVINRPTRFTLASLFPENPAIKARQEHAFWGGPVESGAVFVLARAGEVPADARKVTGDIFMVTTKPSVEKLCNAKGSVRLYLGYSGWGAGQLDREMKLRSWHVLHVDPAMVFDADPESIWPKLIQRTDVFLARRLGRNPSLR